MVAVLGLAYQVTDLMSRSRGALRGSLSGPLAHVTAGDSLEISATTPTWPKRDCAAMTVINPVYFETHFRLHDPAPRWPHEFVIISAFAPTGETRLAQENDSADQRLHAELLHRGCWIARVIGFSQVTGHSEPSWAAEIPLRDACDVGAHYQQDAIYHVVDDILSVCHCQGDTTLVTIGPFRERLQFERGDDTSHQSQESLPEGTATTSPHLKSVPPTVEMALTLSQEQADQLKNWIRELSALYDTTSPAETILRAVESSWREMMRRIGEALP